MSWKLVRRRRKVWTHERHVAGFTLLELMVTLTVFAIIALFAVPSFQQMINKSRLMGAGNELVAALQVARSEAIGKRATAILCPSTDNATCVTTLGNNWIVRVEKGTSFTIARSISIPESLTVRVSPNVLNGNDRISFTADGFAQVGAAATTGTISVCGGSQLSTDNIVDVSVATARVGSTRRTDAGCSAPTD